MTAFGADRRPASRRDTSFDSGRLSTRDDGAVGLLGSVAVDQRGDRASPVARRVRVEPECAAEADGFDAPAGVEPGALEPVELMSPSSDLASFPTGSAQHSTRPASTAAKVASCLSIATTAPPTRRTSVASSTSANVAWIGGHDQLAVARDHALDRRRLVKVVDQHHQAAAAA